MPSISFLVGNKRRLVLSTLGAAENDTDISSYINNRLRQIHVHMMSLQESNLLPTARMTIAFILFCVYYIQIDLKFVYQMFDYYYYLNLCSVCESVQGFPYHLEKGKRSEEMFLKLFLKFISLFFCTIV